MKADRRHFLASTATMGLFAATPSVVAGEEGADEEGGITAPEDLMREHGVLDRILLVYEEGLRRLGSNRPVSPEAFRDSARIIRSFIEDYHGMLEEKYIFPEFEKRQRMTDLVAALRQQHKAGRELTDVVLRNAAAEGFRNQQARRDLTRACREFIRMFRPHEAREDTVLFPALRDIVPASHVAQLGERFEEIEHKLFGDDGFAETVNKVAAIEKTLGIHDLSAFTAQVGS